MESIHVRGKLTSARVAALRSSQNMRMLARAEANMEVLV